MTLEGTSGSASAQALLERVHGPALAERCPLVLGAPQSGRVLALEERGRVAGACTLLVRDVIVDGRTLRAGFIGALTSDPAERRRGVGTRLLARATEALFEEGCLFALLWPDDPRCYVARGFQPVGMELEFIVEAAHIARLDTSSGIRAAAPDDAAAIHRLHAGLRQRVERTPAEMRALLARPQVDTLVLQLERDVVAYASLALASDGTPTIADWAGTEHQVLALVRAHVERRFLREQLATLRFVAPPNARTLLARFHEAGVGSRRALLAHGRLLDVHAAAVLLAELTEREASVSIDCAVHAGRTRTAVKLHGPLGSIALEEGDLLELISPARGDRRRIREVEQALGLELTRLPLPLRVPALDAL